MIQVLLDFAPRWHYLGILVFCLLVTLPLELVMGARVYRRYQQATIAVAGGALPFLVWDFFAIRAGHWEFSPEHTLGLVIAGFPLEEILFFVVVPLCALLTYEAVGVVLDRARLWRHR